jgi:hypothetical protein
MAIYPFTSSAISADKYLPSSYFLHDSPNSLSVGTQKIPFENHKPLGPPVLQATSDSNEAGPFINIQTKIRSENQDFNYFISSTKKENTCQEIPKKARDETPFRNQILKIFVKRKLKMEKKSKAKSILKSPELLLSWTSCQTFTKRKMNTRHVNSVV